MKDTKEILEERKKEKKKSHLITKNEKYNIVIIAKDAKEKKRHGQKNEKKISLQTICHS